MRLATLAALAALLVLAPGCATIFSGSSKVIRVRTIPAGAIVVPDCGCAAVGVPLPPP